MKEIKFNEDVRKFIDLGLIKKVYSSKELSVCNISDTCYAIFNYTDTKHGQWGVIVVPEHAKQIVENNKLYNVLISKFSEQQLYESSFYLNNKSLEIMKNLKKDTSIKGPTTGVGLQWEEEIMAKYKSR